MKVWGLQRLREKEVFRNRRKELRRLGRVWGRVKEINLQSSQTKRALYRPEYSVGMFKWWDMQSELSPSPISPSVKSTLHTHSSVKVHSIREPQWRAEICHCEPAFDKTERGYACAGDCWDSWHQCTQGRPKLHGSERLRFHPHSHMLLVKSEASHWSSLILHFFPTVR